MKDIYFIAVNYNNSKHTLKYIESVNKLSLSDNNVSIIIVDNNSKLKDFLKIKESIKSIKNVKLIRNESNIGYFGGLNTGICDVADKNNKLFVIGNNDLEFNSDFILELNKIQYNDSTMVIAPNIITLDGYHQNPHYINRMSKFRKFGFRIYFTNYYLGRFIYLIVKRYKMIFPPSSNDEFNKRQFIHMGIGSCYILTEHFFKHYSKLDDRVFLWGEESLLAGQLLLVGGRMLYDPKLIVHHIENSSVRRIPTKQAYKIEKESYKIFSMYQ